MAYVWYKHTHHRKNVDENIFEIRSNAYLSLLSGVLNSLVDIKLRNEMCFKLGTIVVVALFNLNAKTLNIQIDE